MKTLIKLFALRGIDADVSDAVIIGKAYIGGRARRPTSLFEPFADFKIKVSSASTIPVRFFGRLAALLASMR